MTKIRIPEHNQVQKRNKSKLGHILTIIQALLCNSKLDSSWLWTLKNASYKSTNTQQNCNSPLHLAIRTRAVASNPLPSQVRAIMTHMFRVWLFIR